MATPKKKVSPGRKKQRRQFYSLKAEGFVVCPNCLETKRAHRVCVCGFYNGRQVTAPKASSSSEVNS